MSPIDPLEFRKTLGSCPTSVVLVTAQTPDGPVGMVIGSFVSVSLAPPLVGFLPGASSSTWPKIHAAERFCVNVLAVDQLDVCNQFAGKDGTKFETLTWRTEFSGAPVIDGVLAWFDCSLHATAEAGDHFWVTGQVEAMALERPDTGPLLFFRGRYGDFEALA